MWDEKTLKEHEAKAEKDVKYENEGAIAEAIKWYERSDERENIPKLLNAALNNSDEILSPNNISNNST